MFKYSFKESWQELFNNKMHIVVLFILPILLVLFMGIELDDETLSNIPMAIIDNDQSVFSQQLVEAFSNHETFNIVYYPDTLEELEKLMNDSHIRCGMIIPKDFYNDMALLKSPSVLMVYDGSHMAMTGTAKASAMEILLTYKAGATMKQLEGRLNMSQSQALSVAQVFEFSHRSLYNPSKSYEDFLSVILMAGYVQAAMVLIAAVSVNHDIYVRRKRDRFGYAFGKCIFYTIMGTISYSVCIALQINFIGIPFNGSYIEAIILSASLCFAVAAFSVLISTLIKNQMVSLIGGGIIFIPNSVMAGTTWPINSMPIGYQAFASYIPFTHYANNIRNIFLKGIRYKQFSEDIVYLLIFGLISILIAELVIVLVQVADNKEGEMTHNELHLNVQEGI